MLKKFFEEQVGVRALKSGAQGRVERPTRRAARRRVAVLPPDGGFTTGWWRAWCSISQRNLFCLVLSFRSFHLFSILTLRYGPAGLRNGDDHFSTRWHFESYFEVEKLALGFTVGGCSSCRPFLTFVPCGAVAVAVILMLVFCDHFLFCV